MEITRQHETCTNHLAEAVRLALTFLSQTQTEGYRPGLTKETLAAWTETLGKAGIKPEEIVPAAKEFAKCDSSFPSTHEIIAYAKHLRREQFVADIRPELPPSEEAEEERRRRNREEIMAWREKNPSMLQSTPEEIQKRIAERSPQKVGRGNLPSFPVVPE